MDPGLLMPERQITSPTEDMELLRSAAVSAGIIAAGFFRREVKSWNKENASPVTEADITVDHYLQAVLLAARPDYGWLSEEGIDSPDRLGRARVFVVDPIDGTRGFIRGDDSWTVSLAVVEAGVPIAGVVYAPVRDELFDAARGAGVRLNGRPLERVGVPGQLPVIPAPGAVHQDLQSAGLDYKRGPAFASLAYRLVQVATGRLDAAVARRGAQDWDIAGAAMILAEAGLSFEDVCSGRPVFNRSEVRHGALAAYAKDCLRPYLVEALRRVYGCPDAESGTLDSASH
jgi:myo-inositol-1(or 4)-monophosphatase